MLWYVAIVALTNLGLGYALGTYLGRKPQPALAGDDTLEEDLV
jgi:hypothetical protein